MEHFYWVQALSLPVDTAICPGRLLLLIFVVFQATFPSSSGCREQAETRSTRTARLTMLSMQMSRTTAYR
jgi:hypothetical protein